MFQKTGKTTTIGIVDPKETPNKTIKQSEDKSKDNEKSTSNKQDDK